MHKRDVQTFAVARLDLADDRSKQEGIGDAERSPVPTFFAIAAGRFTL